MDLHNLRPAAGSTKNRKRVGRGAGSGMGETSGRGHKGQKARSGWTYRYGKEGGQMPLHRRLPKFGFTNIFRKEFQIVNVSELGKIKGNEITPELLFQEGMIRNASSPVKVLGNGTLDRALTVRAAAFSESAVAKIQAAGGKAEVIA